MKPLIYSLKHTMLFRNQLSSFISRQYSSDYRYEHECRKAKNRKLTKLEYNINLFFYIRQSQCYKKYTSSNQNNFHQQIIFFIIFITLKSNQHFNYMVLTVFWKNEQITSLQITMLRVISSADNTAPFK